MQLGTTLGSDPLTVIRHWFHADVWPWPTKPSVYVDARLLQGGSVRASQHAKVVIADAGTSSAQALVTSANFSETAQRHNFEAGWLVRSPWRVEQIHQHFQRLVAQQHFVPLPTC
ncbi:MAG: phospholipase D-like domain-containing protein [Cyanobium sp.]